MSPTKEGRKIGTVDLVHGRIDASEVRPVVLSPRRGLGAAQLKSSVIIKGAGGKDIMSAYNPPFNQVILLASER